MIDIAPPPPIWLPPKPAIIRPAEKKFWAPPRTVQKGLVGFFVPPPWKVKIPDITVSHDGNLTNTSNLSSYTFTSTTSAGPVTVLCVSGRSQGGSPVLDTATWGGVAGDIAVQMSGTSLSTEPFAAIVIWNQACSGNLVLAFDETISAVLATKLSLGNVQSVTPVDVDSGAANAADITLSALASPGPGGVRICAWACKNTSLCVWTNATPVAEEASADGVCRTSNAYDLGDDSGSITANGGTEDQAIVGVSLR